MSSLTDSTNFRPRAPVYAPSAALRLFEQVLGALPAGLMMRHRRVGEMSERLALHLYMTPADARAVGHAGSLYDIGMALVPPDLAASIGPISRNEKEVIHRHSQWGHDILEMTRDPDLKLASLVALHHHERWDGSGYPLGLAGEEICLPARIVALCAVYDALRHPRPGKDAHSHEKALHILTHGDDLFAPNAFDPAVRDTFLSHHSDFRDIADGDGPSSTDP